MAVNADDIRPEELEDGVHEPNSYFKAFDTIVAELDELAKVLTPEDLTYDTLFGDDGLLYSSSKKGTSLDTSA